MDATVDEGDSAIGGSGNFFAVGDENDGGFFFSGELGDEIDDHGAGGGVEIAGGFVGEKDRGLVDQGTGEGGALKLASGKLMRPVMGAVAEADRGEELAGAASSRGVYTSGDEEGEENVCLDGQCGKEVEKLKNKSDFKTS